MELGNKQLSQANLFTRSLFKLEREIHKDIVYLIQSKIDFFGKPKSVIKISLTDYLMAKNITKNDTYSFFEFYQFAEEIKNVGGAFYNKSNSSFVSFSLVDNVQIDIDNPETLKVELARFGKVLFYKEKLDQYIEESTPLGKLHTNKGFTQIGNSIFKIKGIRRKKFFEIISQFRKTGFCKISVLELKMYLGYIEIVDKKTNLNLKSEDQLKFIFIPTDKFDFKDKQSKYSIFERDFLIPAIKYINNESSLDINNLRISRKRKSGRKISHLEFQFDPLNQDLNQKELKCLSFFESIGMGRDQMVFLIKQIGYEEMQKRWIFNVDIKSSGKERVPKYYEKDTQKEIKNIPGYVYKVLFKELQ